MPVSFETDAINCEIDLGSTEDLIDLIYQGSLKRDVNGFNRMSELALDDPYSNPRQ